MPISNTINKRLSDYGVSVPHTALPAEGVDLNRWAVLACDQHTSNPQYWEEVEKLVDVAPSTLRCILPESYLEAPDVAERIEKTHNAMDRYLSDGTLEEHDDSFILVRRTLSDGTVRDGLIVAIDLEKYDYSKGSRTPVRATETTILERLPPRMRIRRGASLELPHVLVMVDDPDRTLIEPLISRREEFSLAYRTELMFDGGEIEGRYVSDEGSLTAIADALERLADPARFRQRYGSDDLILFPVGDGNHSLASARKFWEERKAEGAESDDPARYALVELVNLQGGGLPFHPIHRTVAGISADAIEQALKHAGFEETNDSSAQSANEPAADAVRLHSTSGSKLLQKSEKGGLAVADVDAAIMAISDVRIDYVHGDEAIRQAVSRGETAIELPAIDRDQLLPTVLRDGALPRKAFSLGRAEDKRYYLEARRLK